MSKRLWIAGAVVVALLALGLLCAVWIRRMTRAEQEDHATQVAPCIYVGDSQSALSEAWLRVHHVTGVIRLTHKQEPKYDGIEYLDLPIRDSSHARIDDYFGQTYAFIERHLRGSTWPCGNVRESSSTCSSSVLVYCNLGVSRSVTIVAAYLMEKCGKSLSAVLDEMRQQRTVRPNRGFMKQLAQFEAGLS